MTQITSANGTPSAKYADGTHQPGATTFVDCVSESDVVNCGASLVGCVWHSDAFQNRALQWIQTLMAYMGGSSSWTYWSLNPNSGDTGGILKDDWVSVQQWKLDLLTPYQAQQFQPLPEAGATAQLLAGVVGLLVIALWRSRRAG